MENSDPNKVASNLQNAGDRIAERAFKQSLGGIEALAKQLAPVGHYGRGGKRDSKGRFLSAGKSGGDLRASIRVEYLGAPGGKLSGQLTSALPYAGAQHDGDFYHPGLYTGAAGPKYKSLYAQAAAQFVFSVDLNSGLYNPGSVPVTEPPRFKELLEELSES